MRSASPRDLALPVARVRGLLPLDISLSDGGKRHAQTPRGWVEWQRPLDSGEYRHGGSASPQARATSHARTAPEGSQSQSGKATIPPGPPITEQEAWLKRALEVLALADAAPGPVEFVIAQSLDVLGTAAPTLLPQAALLQAVILHLEPSMFTSLPAAPRRSLQPTQTLGEMPYRYRGSLPYFSLARKQRARVEELHHFMHHLRETTAKTDKIHAINAARMAVGSSAIGISNTRKEFSNIRACHPALIWAMGFWKVYAENRRTSRKKAEMLEMSAVGELIRPFRHFQIFTTERKIQSQEITQQAFILERQMLEVTIKHLEEEKEDLRAEFGASNATLERLRKRLTEQTQKCAALAERIEQAKPERVKLVLCSVMDFVSAAVLQDAQLERTVAHRHLKSRDLSSLLANEEDGIDKLTRNDGFLSRWLNYHLVQVKGVAVDILKTVARARNEKLVRLEGRASGENSSADVETHYNRCRLVRATQRINKIGVDLKDGAILSILYASLASPAAGFDPALLWPLDETNLEVRAERIVDALKTILPTRASQNLLQASDIAPGNPQILTMLLSALFLHQPKIPPIVLTTQAQRPPRAVREQASQLASAAEKAASGCAYEVLQDMARLVQVGEVPKDLAQLEVDELLVRWVNRHLENKENYQPITTLVELKGGRLFYDLLLRIAPEVVKVLPETKLLAEARSPTERKRRMVEFVVHCLQRCTSFPILTAETVKEGPVDLLAAGLAGLFLCRPALNVLPKSQLQKHLDLTEVPRPGWLPTTGPGNLNVPPEEWGMTLGQWAAFIMSCRLASEEKWEELRESDDRKEKGFVNLYQICNHYVKPWTRNMGNSIALLMNNDRPLKAQVMISHAWAEDIVESLVGVLGKASVSGITSNTAVWFCTFSQYQSGDMEGDCGPTVAEQLALGPFKRVIDSNPRFGMLVIHTSAAELYDRLWCVYEVNEAADLGLLTYAAASILYFGQVHKRLMAGETLEDVCAVRSQDATCFSPEDEKMIKSEIESGCGYDALNDTIFKFRVAALERMGSTYRAILDWCEPMAVRTGMQRTEVMMNLAVTMRHAGIWVALHHLLAVAEGHEEDEYMQRLFRLASQSLPDRKHKIHDDAFDMGLPPGFDPAKYKPFSAIVRMFESQELIENSLRDLSALQYPVGWLEVSAGGNYAASLKSDIGFVTATDSSLDEVRKVFERYDDDSSGKVSKGELRKVLLSEGSALTEHDVDIVFSASDADRDGMIDYKEFLNWLSGDG